MPSELDSIIKKRKEKGEEKIGSKTINICRYKTKNNIQLSVQLLKYILIDNKLK